MPGPVDPTVAGVQITNNGLEIADGTNVRATLGILTPAVSGPPPVAATYGLRIISSDGTTVIVDGTSAMFRIVTTGTLTPGAPGAGARTSASATLSTGLTYTPITLWSTGSSFISVAIPYYEWDLATGGVIWSYDGAATWVAGNSTQVTAYQAREAAAGPDSADVFRYYILVQVAI